MEAVRRLPVPGAETDPVLAALIARLPPSGSVWPAKKRAAWMQMVWMAFDLAYEAELGDTLELPAFLKTGEVPVPAKEAEVPKQPPAPYPFLIDKDGFARHGDGRRLLPRDVGGIIYDQRGEGDFSTIVWADDSRGVPHGLQLDISPAF